MMSMSLYFLIRVRVTYVKLYNTYLNIIVRIQNCIKDKQKETNIFQTF